MNEKQLTGTYRTEDFGSAGSRRLLRAGRIPAVIYGKNGNVHISLEAKDFTNKMRKFSESTLLTIKVDKVDHSVLMKDYQENVMRGMITHVDFFEVTTDEVLRANVPVVLHGNAIGTRHGGVLEQVMHEIEVECLPKDLPESFIGDISKIDLNESVHVAQLTIPEGVKILIAKETTIASVKAVKEEVAAPAAEATEEAVAAEPAIVEKADKEK